MPASNYHIGDYTVKTTGNIDLSSKGKNTSIQATGSESSMMLTAKKAVGVFSGSAMAVLHNSGTEAGKVTVGVSETGTVKLAAGPPEGGVTIKLQGPETLELSVGVPGEGSSIIMGPESIIFKVAEVCYTLTPEGITEVVAEVTREVTAEGHNLTAAETEVNIGVEGNAEEVPTADTVAEAGTDATATLSATETAAVATNVATLDEGE